MGEDLGYRIQRTGWLDERTAWAIVRQTAAALAHAAGRGIIHRDVKPANLFLVPAPTGFGLPGDLPMVKVTDFGLAFTRRPEDSAENARLTQTGVLIGTPAYMAPEQFARSDIDHRADIYSLGATAFHALVGKPPFDGATVWDVMIQKVESHPLLGAPTSAESVRLVADMMAPNPDHRVGNYDQLIDRIDRLPCLQGIATPTSGAVRPGRSVVARVGVKRMAWAAVVGCGIAATAAWVGRSGPDLRPAGPPVRMEMTGETEMLFDRQTLLGWRFVQGTELDRDGEGAPVLATSSEATRPYTRSPCYRLSVGIDLHSAAVTEVGFGGATSGSSGGARYAVRITRDGGAVFGRREGGGPFQPLSAAVPYPTADELRDRVPYQEVKVERCADRWEVTFNGQPVYAFRTDSKATATDEVSVRAEGGAVRVESVTLDRLRPAK